MFKRPLPHLDAPARRRWDLFEKNWLLSSNVRQRGVFSFIDSTISAVVGNTCQTRAV
jgi:hypothetical protein